MKSPGHINDLFLYFCEPSLVIVADNKSFSVACIIPTAVTLLIVAGSAKFGDRLGVVATRACKQ